MKKIRVMKNWPLPKTVSELRGFLGLTRYYRRFVQGYGVIAALLTKLLHKDGFKWDEEAIAMSERLKEAMVVVPVLALPDFSLPFLIEIDASGYRLGVVLL